MTTPERLRKRQRHLGVFILVLALFTVIQATFLTIQDREQNDCFQDRFTELSRVSSIRADLSERETQATAGVISVYARAAGIVKDKPGFKLTPEQQKKLNTVLVRRLLEYTRETKRVQEERQKHPVPPYPIGSCEDK